MSEMREYIKHITSWATPDLQNITPAKQKALPGILSGWTALIFIPFCHIYILWRFWRHLHVPVDKAECSCDCWDAIYKGPYETGMLTGYKHFYFNSNAHVFKIWILVITGLVILYETIKYMIELFIMKQLRYSMTVLLVASIYPHYYSWWNYINYINDGFLDEWSHQLFYTVTELVASAAALQMVNRQNKVHQYKLFVILAVGMSHIMGSALDQFFINVIFGKGYLHQVLRDCGLLIPDMLNVIIPMALLIWRTKNLRRGRLCRVLRDKLFMLHVVCTITFVIISLFILYDNVDLS